MENALNSHFFSFFFFSKLSKVTVHIKVNSRLMLAEYSLWMKHPNLCF